MTAPVRLLPPGHLPGQPLTALAPMQDVTDLAFMRVMAHYGAPDYFFTEFFRVHAQSRPERHILRSIDENQTGRPVFAQLIGEDLSHLTRTVEDLLKHPIAGIDLNLGQQLVVFFTAMLGAIGAPGIPSAGMVTMIVVLQSVGLPVEAIAILLPIDRLLDTVRTAVNVEDDMIASMVVQKLTRED